MPEADDLQALVRKWVLKAENDLRAAVRILTPGRDTPTDTVCFHAQQCIEKYLKALLVFRGISFPKTHDLHALLTLVPPDCRPTLDGATQERMTEYATVGRYPDKTPEPTLRDARQAIAVARRVRKEVRRLLPRAALRRPKK